MLNLFSFNFSFFVEKESGRLRLVIEIKRPDSR